MGLGGVTLVDPHLHDLGGVLAEVPELEHHEHGHDCVEAVVLVLPRRLEEEQRQRGHDRVEGDDVQRCLGAHGITHAGEHHQQGHQHRLDGHGLEAVLLRQEPAVLALDAPGAGGHRRGRR
jgi:hypothetical protein